MRELKNRADIKILVDTFYKQVMADDTIGFFFSDVAKLDWEKHIPLMYDFWETVLFGGYKYKGNPMKVHLELNQKEALQPKHFERWFQIWKSTIENNFSGEIAGNAIARAKSVSEVMMMRIKQNGEASNLVINNSTRSE